MAYATKSTTLFSLDSVKTWLGVSTPDKDAILVQMADAVSEFVEIRTGRFFVTRSITEVQDGNGTTLQYLRRYPVVTVTSLTIQRDPFLAVETIANTSWRFAPERGALYLINDVFSKGFQNIAISYQVGYGAQDALTLPQDLVEAAKEIVKLVWMEYGGNAIANATMVFGGTSITVRPDWPKQIKDTLANWRVGMAF